MDNEFMDDDGLRQMRSRRRFQTGLLIVLLLFLMDSRSPESQRNSAQIAVNRNIAHTVKELEPVLPKLPHGVPFKLSQVSTFKGQWRQADREGMVTVVPELEKALEAEQERNPQLEAHAWAGLSHLRNDTIASDKTGDVPFNQGTISHGKMGTMAIDNTEVSMVWGSLALGSDAAPGMTTNYHFQGLFFHNYGQLSAVVGELGDPLKVVWETAHTNAPTPAAELVGGRLASGSSNNKSSDSGSKYFPGKTDPPQSDEVDETGGGEDGGGARKARARLAAVGSGGGSRLGGGMSRRDRQGAGGNGVAKSRSLEHAEIGSALGGVEAGDRSPLPGQREEGEGGIGALALAGREGAAGWSERLGDARHLGLAAAEVAPLPDRVKLASSSAELDASLLTQVDEKGAGGELGTTLAGVGRGGGAGSMRAFPVAVVPSIAVLAPGQESEPLPSLWNHVQKSARAGCMFMLTLQVTETDAEKQETQNGDEAKQHRLASTMTGELVGINGDFWATIEVKFSSKRGSGQPAALSYAVVFTMVCLLQICLLFCRVGIVLAQRRYGRNFMIPSRFLPPKFDYHRPIPPELSEQASMETAGGQDSEEGRDLESGNCLECAICYAAVDGAMEDYMLTPCDHVFHQGCLTRWMDIKMECPTCRQELPPALA